MGKRELKKQYKNLTIDIIDILSELDPTPTKKLMPFITKQFHDWATTTDSEKKSRLRLRRRGDGATMSELLGEPTNEIDDMVKSIIYKWVKPKIDIITEFSDHLENSRLEDNDINNYQNWNHMSLAINEAEIKTGIKSKKNKITILHHDEEWLVLKPLSLEASLNYGYGTKWCTASKSNGDYFHRYSRDGVLVYVINRTNGVKYAFFSSPKEYSVWTETDARVDSMETTVPFDLLTKIREWTNFSVIGPNYNFFEEVDKFQDKIKKEVVGELIGTLETWAEDEDDDVIEDGYDDVVDQPTESYETTAPEWIGDAANVPGLSEEDRVAVLQALTNVDTDVIDREEPMEDDTLVGLHDSVHGEPGVRNERTWSDPYPQGIPEPMNTEVDGGQMMGGDVEETLNIANVRIIGELGTDDDEEF